jgi:hypothetical protein
MSGAYVESVVGNQLPFSKVHLLSSLLILIGTCPVSCRI